MSRAEQTGTRFWAQDSLKLEMGVSIKGEWEFTMLITSILLIIGAFIIAVVLSAPDGPWSSRKNDRKGDPRE